VTARRILGQKPRILFQKLRHDFLQPRTVTPYGLQAGLQFGRHPELGSRRGAAAPSTIAWNNSPTLKAL
jgi:hypothetical protein